MKIPFFNRPRRKDDACYAGQLADFEIYQGKPLTDRTLLRIQEKEFGVPVEAINGRDLKKMSRKDFIKFAGLTGVVVAGASLLQGKFIPRAQAPSAPGIGWNLDSGSLVLPMAYCVYADPSGPTYLARNGLNGTNDFSNMSSAAPTLSSVFSQFVSDGRSGWVHAKRADFPLGSASPAVLFGGAGGFRLSGEAFAPYESSSVGLKGTRFLAGVNNQTLFQGSSGKNVAMQYWMMENFEMSANGFTGLTGIDMTMPGVAQGGSRIDNVGLNAANDAGTGQNGSFNYGWILDGCADIFLVNPMTRGANAASAITCLTASIHFDTPGGDINILHPELLDPMSLIGRWETASLGGYMGTIGGIKLLGNQSLGFWGQETSTILRDCYWGGTGGTIAQQVHMFDANGFNPTRLLIDGANIYMVNGKNFVNLGGGTLDVFEIRQSHLRNIDGSSCNITDSLSGFGRFRRYARNLKISGGVGFGNNPWNNDANGISFVPYTVSGPGDPAGTTSTAGVMAGLAQAYTPRKTGALLIVVTGNGANNTNADGAAFQIRYGTGSAPGNGAALTGSAAGAIANIISPVGGNKYGLVLMAWLVTPGTFVMGTAYWFDVSQAAVTGGTATITGINYHIIELD